ncbi:MAG: peroxiredoxin [Thermodesulfovibrio sp.]|uniref:peroxiredoxin n=1 Tax=unclassified Thermodesulfovibrio TaxID=2645936 RepID=UPI00083B9954|nr:MULTISPECIES: peroxiredoxin [unclassified Thermodesulfovibrio]MDI1472410.1 peroxiredoxin [Thermodesulfovibrio sp. 1176]MDI6714275.1 peroxiredoxin [Thermodesulfovibrio sp.]ODA44639.1 putative peroxiredoxin [Thermodesulfovibrio sp. N1]
MEVRMPLLGEKIEDRKVKTTHGVINFPADYAGKWVVLFSHPADFTPVCTTEFVAFQKRFEEFKKLNCELIGLSIDQVFAHIKWVEWIKEKLGVEISFPIIADDMGEVAKSFGMISPAKGTNTIRAVFIIDPQGILRLVLYYPQEVGRNIDEILRAVKALQTSDANKVAIPAGWPNNELIGDKVIIPPASDVKTSQERQKQFECFDWWFCYKKL